MKDLRRRFERFCLKNRGKGIPNLMLVIAIGNLAVFALSYIDPSNIVYSYLCFSRSAILRGQVWRLFSYIFTYLNDVRGAGLLLAAVSLFCYYQFGKILESYWGTFRFNLYYLTGLVLTDLAARVGYHLALSGAETFRVEETIRRIIGAYGIECEAFSIPNCVMVSLEAANGKPLMVMKRVDFHGNDLESVEKLNALSRRICAETPDPSVAAQWLDETLKGRRHYSVPVYYLGNFCAAAGFCPVFGGTLRDSLFAGLLGLIIGFVSRQMDRRETNPFFSTIVEAFAMAVPAYLAAGFHLVDYIDFVIIGTLMILVPGLLITTSMRDIIYGDTNSGINRIVQVLLSARRRHGASRLAYTG